MVWKTLVVLIFFFTACVSAPSRTLSLCTIRYDLNPPMAVCSNGILKTAKPVSELDGYSCMDNENLYKLAVKIESCQ